jgi:hypothetical protein
MVWVREASFQTSTINLSYLLPNTQALCSMPLPTGIITINEIAI